MRQPRIWIFLLFAASMQGCSGGTDGESEIGLNVRQVTNGHFVLLGAIPMENNDEILKALDREGIDYEIGPLSAVAMWDFWVDPIKIERTISLVDDFPSEMKKHIFIARTLPRTTLKSSLEGMSERETKNRPN